MQIFSRSILRSGLITLHKYTVDTAVQLSSIHLLAETLTLNLISRLLKLNKYTKIRKVSGFCRSQWDVSSWQTKSHPLIIHSPQSPEPISLRHIIFGLIDGLPFSSSSGRRLISLHPSDGDRSEPRLLAFYPRNLMKLTNSDWTVWGSPGGRNMGFYGGLSPTFRPEPRRTHRPSLYWSWRSRQA